MKNYRLGSGPHIVGEGPVVSLDWLGKFQRWVELRVNLLNYWLVSWRPECKWMDCGSFKARIGLQSGARVRARMD